MKRLLLILFAMLLMVSCSSPQVSAPDSSSEASGSGSTDSDSLNSESSDSESEDVPEETIDPVLQEVDEDVFYFVNELEYSRLYSQRIDGSDLKLVVDAYCYDVQQEGDTVYYLVGGDLCTYHIPTGQQQVLLENVMSYEVDGIHLAYTLDGAEDYAVDLRYHNLETHEDILLKSVVIGDFTIGYGYIYYSEYLWDEGTVPLYAYELSTQKTTILADQYSTCYSLLAAETGVYFQASAMDYFNHWYFTSSDGSETQSLENTLSEYDQLIAVTDSGFLALHEVYSEDSGATIHHYQNNGADAIIYSAEDNDSVYVTSLTNDRFLIQQSRYIEWGPVNEEYGYYENAAFQSKYYLLTAQGSLTPLDVTGELGTMYADGDFPVLDSSTARKPITAALHSLFVKNYGYEGAEPICSTTHLAWLGIADGLSDLAFLAAPTEEELAYLASKNVDVEMKLYGGDGLVFIGNSANPVTDLTHEQILGIYRGEITNWKEVGGPDHPITVYYRDDQSGSQRLFESLVFKGEELPDWENSGFMIMDDMSSIVDITLSDPYAIGYSIMTYLDDVYEEEALQVFSVNGVAPSPDSIADSSYAYHTKGYIVIRSDEPADSPARRLYDWFGCPVSDDLLKLNSVTPLSE